MSLPAKYNLLKKYPNEVYLETGLWRGDSMQQALDAGFKKVISIDNDPKSIRFCKDRFNLVNHPDHRIELHLGDSAEILWDVIKNITCRMTIFLDSHYSLLEGEVKGKNPFPLMKELEQISRHEIKDHTIIIDDMLYLTHPDVTGWSKREIEYKIRNEIYMYYRFDLVPNPVIDNMLIAYP